MNRLNVQIRNFATGSVQNSSVSFHVFARIYRSETEVLEHSIRFKMKSSKHKFIYISLSDWQRFIQWKRMEVLDSILNIYLIEKGLNSRG